MDKPAPAAHRSTDGSAPKPRRPRKKKQPLGAPASGEGSASHLPNRKDCRPDRGKAASAGDPSAPRAPPAPKSNGSQVGETAEKAPRRRRPRPPASGGSTAGEAPSDRGDRNASTSSVTAADSKPGRKGRPGPRSTKSSGAAAKSKSKPNPKAKTKPPVSKKPEKPGKPPRAPPEKLKVVIRRLPPTLPEAVFWQAVAPYVPFPPPDVATTTHTAMVPCDQFPASSQENVRVQAKPTLAPPSAKVSAADSGTGPSEPTANGGDHHDEQNDGTSGSETELAVPRRVCRFPIVEQVTWHEEYLRWYIPGKRPKPPNSHVTFSRAYICFAKAHEVAQFHRQFNGHLFVDKQGRKYPALVEFAPSQLHPRIGRFLDPLTATIDDDPDFQAFAAALQGSRQPSETEPSQPAKATDAPTIVVGAIAGKPNGTGTDPPTSTPLLDYLRDKRLKEAWSKKRGSKPTKLEHGRVTILKKSSPDGSSGISKSTKATSGKKATEPKPDSKAKKILKRSGPAKGAQGPDAASKASAAAPSPVKKTPKKSEKKKPHGSGGGASVKSANAPGQSKLDKK
ncbi:hypothetical protein H4R35_000859 [Dimargaris xerosporica]|nr:hypothetical protein H4R35_000859 [Dimargaris xerosporica]